MFVASETKAHVPLKTDSYIYISQTSVVFYFKIYGLANKNYSVFYNIVNVYLSWDAIGWKSDGWSDSN